MFYTVLKEATGEYQEKKSVFIGHTKRVESEDEAKEFIEKIKKKHREARHNIHAYIIGENKEVMRYSDDGEPQGTAGIPCLEVLKKKDLTNVVMVVTRYFGGTLLGAGGLVRAYSKATSMALDNALVVEKVKGIPIYIIASYDFHGKIQYYFGQNNIHIEDTEFTDEVKIKVFLKAEEVNKIKQELIQITSDKVVFEEDDEKYYFKNENRLYEEAF